MSMTIEQAKSELMQIYGMLSPDKQRAIDTLVKMERKTGHWKISQNDCFVSCSECGLRGDKGIYKHYRWCPSCGAKMGSEAVDEVKVGDEIVSGDSHVVVTYVSPEREWNGFLLNKTRYGEQGQGYTCVRDFKGWQKTGEHFSQIAEMFEPKESEDKE